MDVGYGSAEIVAAARTQIEHGVYEPEPIYGDGNAGERIAHVLATIPLTSVKRMTY
jgi:UDP-N-acetylglucosamine 2-epimerase